MRSQAGSASTVRPSSPPVGSISRARPPTRPPRSSTPRSARVITRSRPTNASGSGIRPPSWLPERFPNRGWQPAGMSDPFDLQRFLDAQAQTYDQALAELRDGAKRTHWMWFVFPQIAGLGRSGMAQRFAISGLPEARAYAAHPTLRRRAVAGARAPAGPHTPHPV